MTILEEGCAGTAPDACPRAAEGASRPALEGEKSAKRPADAAAPGIMIVEDSPLIALDLAETVKELGFEVHSTVATREQALAQIVRRVPDFAVIDLHLGMSGSGDGEALLSMLSGLGCRCLVFSGDDDACRRIAETYPRVPVLSKPAQVTALVREIERLRELPAD